MPAAPPKQRKIAIVGSRSVGMYYCPGPVIALMHEGDARDFLRDVLVALLLGWGCTVQRHASCETCEVEMRLWKADV